MSAGRPESECVNLITLGHMAHAKIQITGGRTESSSEAHDGIIYVRAASCSFSL